jgi:hypothetical protein
MAKLLETIYKCAARAAHFIARIARLESHREPPG